jgi:hypothetical protein
MRMASWIFYGGNKWLWSDSAVDQMQACSEKAMLRVNLIIDTELLVLGPDVTALDASGYRSYFPRLKVMAP